MFNDPYTISDPMVAFAMRYWITKDDKYVEGPFRSRDEAAVALLRLQPMSIRHATTYEGWQITADLVL